MSRFQHRIKWSRWLLVLLSCSLSFSTFRVASEDIDIFSVDETGNVNKPNVLFILDNSANWSRQSQQWPGGLDQGQSEVRAIKRVINQLPENSVNVGLLMYSTEGSASDTDGGYVRFHIQSMNTSGKSAFSSHLDTIFNNINAPVEKRSQGNPFGDLFWDAYNYLSSGNQSKNGAGTPASRADSNAYTSLYSRFRSPLTTADSCTRTIIIFIGNNVSGGPTGDSSANVSALQAAGGNTTQIPFADYVVTSTPQQASLGYSAACHASASTCSAAVNNSACTDAGFTSCFCDANDLNNPPVDCTDSRFKIVGTHTTNLTETIFDDNPGVTTTNQDLPGTSYCQRDNPGTLSCPAPSTSTSPGPGANETTTTYTSWSNCRYVDTGPGCHNNQTRKLWVPRGDKTVRTVKTRVTPTTTQNDLGNSTACYSSAAQCTAAITSAVCPSSTNNGGCVCTDPVTPNTCTSAGTKQFQVKGNYVSTSATATGTFRTPPTQGGKNFMMDEWARFLRQVGVPLPNTDLRANVTTYTLDVFNAQQHPDFSALLFNTARAGGGKYYQAKNEDQIERALIEIFDEIQAVNSAFSSASLPVNATNRAQNENQVFIGLFRPDRQKRPLWFGNLKRYQLISSGNTIELGDSLGNRAINNQTGFIADCAVSFWTTDSGSYWSLVNTADPLPQSRCSTASNAFSDLPDGPFVEKGAVAEVLRKRTTPRVMKTLVAGSLTDFNTSSASALGLTDEKVVRFIRGEDVHEENNNNNTTEPRSTIHGDVIHSRPLPVNYGGSTGVVVYYGANDGTLRAVRASDGVELWSFIAPEHVSRLGRLASGPPSGPTIKFFGDTSGQPKDYFFDGSSSVFQNADNSKVWLYTTQRRGGRRIYAFDVTNPSSSSYPAFLWSKGCPNPIGNDIGCDVGFSGIGQTWALPNVAFIKGYSSLTNADGSTNVSARPVVVVGGGYDGGDGRCEDQNTASPTGCSKGGGVYVLDGMDGTLIRHFNFGGRSVAADVALIDTNGDRMVDYAYAADTGGNIYRMDFVNTDGTPNTNALTWSFSRIAHTSGGGRKFLFTPALFQATGKVVYVAIGSGDREHPLRGQYPFTDVVNRFYMFNDALTDVNPTTVLNLDSTASGDMLDYTTEASPCCNAPVLPGDPDSPSYATGPKGWFMTLNQFGPKNAINGTGEQVVTSAVIAAGFVIFSTNRPTPDDGNACTNSLGEARGYIVNLFNASGAIGVPGAQGGNRSSIFAGGGLPPSPVVAVVPIGGVLKPVVIGAVPKHSGGGGFGGDGSDGSGSGAAGSPLQAQEFRPPIRSIRTPVYWYRSGDAD
jgi:Tfp pilus tip-associated adhesin PilY1